MLVVVPLLSLFACTGTEEVGLVDLDGDGVMSDTDCDDRDPRRAPGLEEACDRLDNNCNDLVDEEDSLLVDGTTWYRDADGDGFGDGSSSVTACGRTDGFVGSAGDCDDTDADVATSSEWYADADGDGFGDAADALTACGAPVGHVADATDCDDTQAGVYPGATEVCGDGLDEDCDGTPNGCGPTGDTTLPNDTWVVVGEGDQFGWAVADLGGGRFAVGATGEVSVWDAGGTTYARFTATGLGGYVATAGDTDGDGTADLLAGGDTTAWLLRGPLDTDRTAGDVALALADGTVGGLAPAGDQDGDGLPDLLIGVADGTDAAYVFGGSVSGEIDAAGALATVSGRRPVSGAAVAGIGDLDGDGADDVAVTDGYATMTISNQGAVYVLPGPVSGAISLEGVATRIVGDQVSAGVGMRVAAAGDVDGDGYADVLVGAPARDGVGVDSGSAWLVRGPVASSVMVSAADWTLAGGWASEGLGGSLAAADVNGDGRPDALVGGTNEPGSSGNRGEVVLCFAPLSGVTQAADADARVFGDEDTDRAGHGLSGFADTEGDGFVDVLIGAPGAHRVYGLAGGAGI